MDKDGNTPLHIAARYGHELLINTLITSGADCTRFVLPPVDKFVSDYRRENACSKRLFFLSPKARSPWHVPSPPGGFECSLRLLPEAAVLR